VRLIRSKFESWLRAKPPTEIVGENRDCHACPLALFYEQASGGCEVVISSDRNGFGYVIDRGYGERKMPAWADAFAFLVDGDANSKISAGRSLEVLEQIS
jgi:hypothetical protein